MGIEKQRLNDINTRKDTDIETVDDGQAIREQEKLTRRQALARIGFQAGTMALLTLSVDDLARLAAKKLEQRGSDLALAKEVALEFRHAGVAFADSEEGNCNECLDGCAEDEDYECVECEHGCAIPSLWCRSCGYGGSDWVPVGPASYQCPSCGEEMQTGKRKRQHKCANGRTAWNKCEDEGNRLECCQEECENCCRRKLFGCGSPSVRDSIITICQQHCAAIAGQVG